MIVNCKTAAEVKKAIKAGYTAKIVAGVMIALTLSKEPSANIIISNNGYLNLTLDSSQATVKTWGSSQATVETWDSSQATVETWGSSQATVKTRGSSQATVETWGSSQATVKTWGSSQATVETRDSSQATVKTWGSSQATVKTWGSKCPLPDNITALGGEQVATGVPDLLRDVADAALASPDAINMKDWHCGTSHCISGWATHLAGKRGKELENRLGNHGAGLVLLGREAAAHFYDSDDDARAWLSQFATSEATP